MSENSTGKKPIRNCLLAVYNKEGLRPLAEKLHACNVQLYATAGTCAYLKKEHIPAIEINQLTQYPDLLGGRVKTLHPKIFGGLLYRRENAEDLRTLSQYSMPQFDMLVVNLYPFEEALQAGEEESALIEKIDIGGVALLRAAAKNFHELWVLSSPTQYTSAATWISTRGANTTLSLRRQAAQYAFHVSSHYDTAIFSYFNNLSPLPVYKKSVSEHRALRYGENPHQRATFYGSLKGVLDSYQGRELSYNNLLDIDAAFAVLQALGNKKATFVIIKHSDPCGVGIDALAERAYEKAYAGDSLSAFGGIYATNRTVGHTVAKHLSSVLFEAVIAPDFTTEALEIFALKKQRRILRYNHLPAPTHSLRSALGGVLHQETDSLHEKISDWEIPTTCQPDADCINDLHLAYNIVKCARSNAITLVKGGKLLGCGTGQTSRIDALQIAINKTKRAGHSLQGAVMASEAFFPFPDCVEVAHQAGIQAIIQPGGSKNDHLSINYCQSKDIPMVLTRKRHFRH